ncbi:hypothetical protein B9Z19DRAFT_1073468 [Tuber borchii]|uniref:Uncharacterized protein n=1 Tax=Tuber borchii TaxID=42251 RepID=A0A2T7A5V2_TUBBO|nr:hypothetical protein B9Z19DRAFT_1073468 [Tuber borchii]
MSYLEGFTFLMIETVFSTLKLSLPPPYLDPYECVKEVRASNAPYKQPRNKSESSGDRHCDEKKKKKTSGQVSFFWQNLMARCAT